MQKSILELPKIEQHPTYKEALRKRFASIATELVRLQKKFTYPGIKSSSYQKLQALEVELGDRYMRNVDGIDEIIPKLKKAGIEIRIGTDGRGICIMPAGSRDNKSSTLPLRHLDIVKDMNLGLKHLIKLDQLLHNE